VPNAVEEGAISILGAIILLQRRTPGYAPIAMAFGSVTDGSGETIWIASDKSLDPLEAASGSKLLGYSHGWLDVA
jgi:hypothetical protein